MRKSTFQGAWKRSDHGNSCGEKRKNPLPVHETLKLHGRGFERNSPIILANGSSQPQQNAFSRLGLKCASKLALLRVAAHWPSTTAHSRGFHVIELTGFTGAQRKSPMRYIVMAVVAGAIALPGYFAFGGQQRVPDATFTLLSGQKVSTSPI